jgi:O-antigen/teichoic acid export membrane protein
MVKHYFEAEVAGYYASAGFIGRICLYIVGPIVVIMFPKTSSLFEKSEDTKPVLKKAMISVACICGILAISYIAVPELLVRVFFGVKFINSAPLLPGFGIAMFMFSLVNVLLLYQLSIRSFKFVAPLIIGVFLEILLIRFFHDKLIDVVAMLIISSSILFLVNYLLVFRTKKI